MPLSADDIGHRVVVRRTVGQRAGRPVFTDVLGVLVSYGEGGVAVRRSDGRTVDVPMRQIAAGKRVPPKPVRRSVLALEAVAERAWPAPDTEWLGQWKLRAAGGWTGRANSVLPLGAPDRPVEEALIAVSGWYAARGLAPRFAVTTEDPLDEELARRGWTTREDSAVLVQTADVATALDGLPVTDDVLVDCEPTDEWFAIYRGGSAPADIARRVLAGPENSIFATIPGIAIGRAVPHGQWLGVSCVEVAPAYRRTGRARQIMSALLSGGLARRATTAWLQVAGDNAAGVSLYASLGFATHHRYRYRLAP